MLARAPVFTFRGRLSSNTLSTPQILTTPNLITPRLPTPSHLHTTTRKPSRPADREMSASRGNYYALKYGSKGGIQRGQHRGGGGGGGRFRDGLPNEEITLGDENGRNLTDGELKMMLEGLEGKGYGGYKRLEGRTFDFPGFQLRTHKIQGDSYAPPSKFAILLPASSLAWPTYTSESYTEPSHSIPTTDYLTRLFNASLSSSRALSHYAVSQAVLPRSTCLLHTAGPYFELRFKAALPANGRSIRGHDAARILVDEVKGWIARVTSEFRVEDVERFVRCYQDQEALRAQLKAKNLVAFIANGSILPRASGVDDHPLSSGAVPFLSPPSLEITLSTPHSGPVKGMGIPTGVTILTGGGFHGKSTLLSALQVGIYNHIPADGRSLVVTLPTAFKIRSEDGRAVTSTDISPLISNLPGGVQTTSFSTPNASGSTSMAAMIVEAVEMGSEVLLVDEDTSATNLLVRDRRMQALVRNESITPLVEKVGALKARGVSTIIVCGGCGDYLDVADTVIGLENYLVGDLTAKARELVAELPAGVLPKPGFEFAERTFELKGILGARTSTNAHSISFGKDRPQDTLDLSFIEQLIEPGQVNYICGLLRELESESKAHGLMGGNVRERIEGIMRRRVEEVEVSGERKRGDVSWCRPLEVAAAVGRLRWGVGWRGV